MKIEWRQKMRTSRQCPLAKIKAAAPAVRRGTNSAARTDAAAVRVVSENEREVRTMNDV
jgi:hypothetical protein